MIKSILIERLPRKVWAVLSSTRFRLRFHIFSGKVRSDCSSISKCGFGKNVSMKGSFSSIDSSIFLGGGSSIAETAEIGAEKNGCIVLGNNVSVGSRTIISTAGGSIKIGRSTSFFSDCIISGLVTIGEDCLFAKNVSVLSGTHQIYGDGSIRENDAANEMDPNYRPMNAISIGDDCWLGLNSVILPGVSLGKGVVVGANAVVTKSFPDYSIVAGVPAKVIGSRLQQQHKAAQ
ncbi:MAG: acyltransferase [Pseudomonadota bacterium]